MDVDVTRDDVEAALWRAGLCRSVVVDELLKLVDGYADTWSREMRKRDSIVVDWDQVRKDCRHISTLRRNGKMPDRGRGAMRAGVSAENLNGTGTKTCGSCGETKLVTEFYQKKQSRDGRQKLCKACDHIRRVDRRAALNATRRSVALGLGRRDG